MAIVHLSKPWLWKRFTSASTANYVGVKNELVIDLRSVPPVVKICDGVTPGAVAIIEPPIIGIRTPTILTPANGEFDIGVSPIITSSLFQCYDARYDEVVHHKSQWQIANDAEFTDLVLDTKWCLYLNSLDAGRYDVVLEKGKSYYLRVRYLSHYRTQSNWSPSVFITVDAGLPTNYRGRLLASNGKATDNLGFRVKIDYAATTIVASAQGTDIGQSNSGSVLLFDWNGTSWIQGVRLYSNLVARNNAFGKGLAISGDGNTIAAGAPGGATEHVCVFKRTNGTWGAATRLQNPRGAVNDEFGLIISLNYDGTVLVIGSPIDASFATGAGSIHIYKYVNNAWSYITKKEASDRNADDQFGYSVSLSKDGKALAVGAQVANITRNNSTAGSVYIFEDVNGVWTETAILESSDGVNADKFGYDTAMSADGNTVVVGAFGDDDVGTDSGSAYIFTKTNGVWAQTIKIKSTDLAAGDYFGFSVAINPAGNVVAIGAQREDTKGTDSGTIYIFQLTGVGWVQQLKIVAPDGKASDYFGTGLDLSAGSVLVAGSYQDDDGASNAGSIYVFDN